MRQMIDVQILNRKKVWTTRSISIELFGSDEPAHIKKTERWINKNKLNFQSLTEKHLHDEMYRSANQIVVEEIVRNYKKKRKSIIIAEIHNLSEKLSVFVASDGRNKRRWIFLNSNKLNPTGVSDILELLINFEKKDNIILPKGSIVKICREICFNWKNNEIKLDNKHIIRLALEIYSHSRNDIKVFKRSKDKI